MAVRIPLAEVTRVLKMESGFEAQLRFDIWIHTSKMNDRENTAIERGEYGGKGWGGGGSEDKDFDK